MRRAFTPWPPWYFFLATRLTRRPTGLQPNCGLESTIEGSPRKSNVRVSLYDSVWVWRTNKNIHLLLWFYLNLMKWRDPERIIEEERLELHKVFIVVTIWVKPFYSRVVWKQRCDSHWLEWILFLCFWSHCFGRRKKFAARRKEVGGGALAAAATGWPVKNGRVFWYP